MKTSQSIQSLHARLVKGKEMIKALSDKRSSLYDWDKHEYLNGYWDVHDQWKRYVDHWVKLHGELVALGGKFKGNYCSRCRKWGSRGFKIRHKTAMCHECYNYSPPRDPVWRMKYAPDALYADYRDRHPTKTDDELYDHICKNIERNSRY